MLFSFCGQDLEELASLEVSSIKVRAASMMILIVCIHVSFTHIVAVLLLCVGGVPNWEVFKELRSVKLAVFLTSPLG